MTTMPSSRKTITIRDSVIHKTARRDGGLVQQTLRDENLLMRLKTVFWATAAIAVIAPVFSSTFAYAQVITTKSKETTLFEAKTGAGDVTVVREKDGVNIRLAVNGQLKAFTGDGTARRAHYPFLLAPDPKNALIVGVGSGASVVAALANGVKNVTVVTGGAELWKAAAFFNDGAINAASGANVKAINVNAASWLKKPEGKYDVIITGLASLDTLDSPEMLTVENFQRLRSTLAPGGVVAQWVRLGSMEFPDFQKTMATFFTVFPDATVWSGDINPVNSWVMLLGSEKSLALDAEKVQARLKKLEQVNDMAEGRNVYSFLSFYIAGAKNLAPLTENIPIHAEGSPALVKKTIDQADEGQRSSEIFLTLANYRAPVTERTAAGEAVREKLVSYFKGRSTLLAGRRVAIAGVAEKEIALYDKALENAPEDPHIALSYMALGMAYYKSGLYDTTAQLLEKSKKIAPDKMVIRFYLGKTYEKMGHAAKANEEFNAVREYAPEYMERVIIAPKKGVEPIR